MSEAQIQRAIVQHLQLRATTPCWFAVPNGGWRNPITAKNLKLEGVRPGVADLIFLKNGEAFALELKTTQGRQSEAQRQFLLDWMGQKGSCFVAHGLDEAMSALKTWGLIR